MQTTQASEFEFFSDLRIVLAEQSVTPAPASRDTAPAELSARRQSRTENGAPISPRPEEFWPPLTAPLGS